MGRCISDGWWCRVVRSVVCASGRCISDGWWCQVVRSVVCASQRCISDGRRRRARWAVAYASGRVEVTVRRGVLLRPSLVHHGPASHRPFAPFPRMRCRGPPILMTAIPSRPRRPQQGDSLNLGAFAMTSTDSAPSPGRQGEHGRNRTHASRSPRTATTTASASPGPTHTTSRPPQNRAGLMTPVPASRPRRHKPNRRAAARHRGRFNRPRRPPAPRAPRTAPPACGPTGRACRGCCRRGS
jgi:hypothetical protein